jgi:hypothetical protein
MLTGVKEGHMPKAASNSNDFNAVFQALRTVLEPYIAEMHVVQDNERGLYLNTRTVMKNGQPLFFASIAINRKYVSFYLFPVSLYPDLVDGIGNLRKRMQGTNCFNFRKADPDQVEKMRSLVRAGYDRLKREGQI